MSNAYRDVSIQLQPWNHNCFCKKSWAINGGWIHFEQGPYRLCSIFFGEATEDDLDKAVDALNKCIPCGTRVAAIEKKAEAEAPNDT